MTSTVAVRHVVFYFVLLTICVFFITPVRRSPSPIRQTVLSSNLSCFEWDPTINPLLTTYKCSDLVRVNSFIWTYDGTGLMKYIDWIVRRRFGNIRVTRLNDDCHIIQEDYFTANITHRIFIQVYILSTMANFDDRFSECSIKIDRIANFDIGLVNHIYFKRKSIRAMIFFQKLDFMKNNFTIDQNTKVLLEIEIKKVHESVLKRFPIHFRSKRSIKWKTIDSEDLIQTNLIDGEKQLTDFLALLQLNAVSSKLKDTIEYDSHWFTHDSTWWDRSDVAEHVLDMSIPTRPSNMSYTDDFFYLHGNLSFTQYLYDNRQCAQRGVFVQMQSETLNNRTSTDQPNRCLSKTFDCAFSDLYSFDDREQMYRESDRKPIKCAFAVPSPLDEVRRRYGRNHTCQTVILTSIINCYDGLPHIEGSIPSSSCLVALLDRKTLQAYKKVYKIDSKFPWDLIDLGENAVPFSIGAKLSETLRVSGLRMFPLAKWIVWVDGKGYIRNITEILQHVRVPVIGALHPMAGRTPEGEVNPTISRLQSREKMSPHRLNISLTDLEAQRKQYQYEGFYVRSNALNIHIYDIAIFLYRNHQPCISRFLCGWHNEINYYSYRGQLSVFYSVLRLNLTAYFDYLLRKYYDTALYHLPVC